jgi:ketosteroid isomerase-like protein
MATTDADGADAAVDRFNDAFARQDLDAVMAAMTADCVFDNTSPPDGHRYVGQEQVRAAWADFFASSPGARIEAEARFSCGDRVVVQWRYDWQRETPGHVRGVDLFRVEDGLVAEKLTYVKG